MVKKYKTVSTDDVIGKLPAKRRTRIKKRAAELIAEELGLQELRRAKKVT